MSSLVQQSEKRSWFLRKKLSQNDLLSSFAIVTPLSPLLSSLPSFLSSPLRSSSHPYFTSPFLTSQHLPLLFFTYSLAYCQAYPVLVLFWVWDALTTLAFSCLSLLPSAECHWIGKMCRVCLCEQRGRGGRRDERGERREGREEREKARGESGVSGAAGCACEEERKRAGERKRLRREEKRERRHVRLHTLFLQDTLSDVSPMSSTQILKERIRKSIGCYEINKTLSS